MPTTVLAPREVIATVAQVLPRFGLAYLVDDREVTWGVTRSTSGSQPLDALAEGQRVRLTVRPVGECEVPSGWAALD